MSYLKIFEVKKSNLKKERIPSSTKEKTVSTEQYETTQRYPHLATRPFITRPTLIAGRCATSHDTERFRVFVWHVFAATDIERTFCQYARGCALRGCDIDIELTTCQYVARLRYCHANFDIDESDAVLRITVRRGCAPRGL